MPFAALIFRKVGQTWSFRGSKSRNKVTVGEPAVGSLERDWLCRLILPPTRSTHHVNCHRLWQVMPVLDETVVSFIAGRVSRTHCGAFRKLVVFTKLYYWLGLN